MKGNLLSFGILMPFLMTVLSSRAQRPVEESSVAPVASASAFRQLIERLGLQNPSADWSDQSDIRLPEPRCAYVNITGIDHLPVAKGLPMNAWMEVYDGQGNYFRKRVVLDAQGSSSLIFPKKSFRADFCDDEWVGDSVPDIRIGSWVRQDAFNFKAYYNDYLRGVGTVGYKLYDLIASDRGAMWTRVHGGLDDPNTSARCYPDGFPCHVYLNGSFHGLFAWELRKHRRNMSQKKTNPLHIHLDGTLYDGTLWNGQTDWTAFEVRNPKGLLTTDGTAYDGDSPTELADGATKEAIMALGSVCGRLREMEAAGAGSAAIRQHFEDAFDLGSLIDYACFNYLTANFDGWQKNWQWFTYDGTKWFVAPYDLDCTFGNFYTGNFLLGPERSGHNGFASMSFTGPYYFIMNYYLPEVFEHYNELRQRGIVTPETVNALLSDWYERMGQEGYAQEWARWPESKCISEDVVSEGWKAVDDWSGYAQLPQYADSVAYAAGDRCIYGYRIWEATDSVSGVVPVVQQGYHDSLGRLTQWVEERFRLIDDLTGYMPALVVDAKDRSRDGFARDEATYDLQGRRLTSPLARGLYIRNGRKTVVR